MKLKSPLVAAFVAVLALSACGGGGGGSAAPAPGVVVANPAQLNKIDLVVGTGAEASAGKKATVKYTGWLYSTTGTDHKGKQFDDGTLEFTVGSGQLIPGFEQGVAGMKVGGKRRVEIPSSLGYGAAGNAVIPGNAGLVFEVELTKVQ